MDLNLNVLHQLSYGMFVVTARAGDRVNGQIANAVFQVTSAPPTIGVSINTGNYTHELIAAGKVFTVSVLAQSAPIQLIGQFGFKCGRGLDKFAGTACRTGVTGAPIVTDHATGYLECEVINSLTVGTHTIFVGKVVAAGILAPGEPMTYAHYHQVKKGTVPKSAPHYVAAAPAPAPAAAGPSYRCTVCNYVYDPAAGDPDHGVPAGTPFEKVPEGWLCPVCGVDKTNFVKEG